MWQCLLVGAQGFSEVRTENLMRIPPHRRVATQVFAQLRLSGDLA